MIPYKDIIKNKKLIGYLRGKPVYDEKKRKDIEVDENDKSKSST